MRLLHEKTNRRVLANKKDLNISNGWKTLVNKYPTKCSVCDKYVGKGIKILWHVNEKIVMHKADCITQTML